MVNTWSRSPRNQTLLDGTRVTFETTSNLRTDWSGHCASLPLQGRGRGFETLSAHHKPEGQSPIAPV